MFEWLASPSPRQCIRRQQAHDMSMNLAPALTSARSATNQLFQEPPQSSHGQCLGANCVDPIFAALSHTSQHIISQWIFDRSNYIPCLNSKPHSQSHIEKIRKCNIREHQIPSGRGGAGMEPSLPPARQLPECVPVERAYFLE